MDVLQGDFRGSNLEEALALMDNYVEVALDTETTGKFEDLYDRNIVMLQIGDERTQIVVDCRKTSPLPLLQKLLGNKTPIFAHNVKFDYTVVYMDYGLELENVFDTMLASQLVDYEQEKEKGLFTLESCVRRHVDPYAYTSQLNLFAPAYTKDTRKSFSSIKDEDFTPSQIYYGAADAAYTYILGKRLRKIAEEQGLLQAVAQENEFVKVLADMEINGLPTDRDLFIDASKEAVAAAEALRKELEEVSSINWDSPKQVNAVFKEMGVDTLIIDKKSGELKESVGKVVIEKQASRFPILQRYINYKLADKKRKAYGDKFLRHINGVDGRIHSSFLQLMSTGRTSSSSPNMQNIPRDKKYRESFRPEEGYVFVGADFSNQEARILADFCQDEALLQAVQQSDIHLATAKNLFNNPDLTKESIERQYAKSVLFLTCYGGGPKKLSETFGIPMQKAKETILKFYEAFPGLKPYFDIEGSRAKNVGYIEVNPITKRRAGLPKWEVYKWCAEHIAYYKRRGWEVRPEIEEFFNYYDSKYQRLSQNYRIQNAVTKFGELLENPSGTISSQA